MDYLQLWLLHYVCTTKYVSCVSNYNMKVLALLCCTLSSFCGDGPSLSITLGRLCLRRLGLVLLSVFLLLSLSRPPRRSNTEWLVWLSSLLQIALELAVLLRFASEDALSRLITTRFALLRFVCRVGLV